MRTGHRVGIGRVAILLCVAAQLCQAQTVIHLSDPAGSLAERFQRALGAARQNKARGEFWIGYSIERLMEENSYVGNHFSDPERNRPTLEELLSGMSEETSAHRLRERSMTSGDDGRSREKVRKEIGILAHYDGAGELDEVLVSNLTLHVDLNNETLFWIGGAGQNESLAWLTTAFASATTVKPKEAVITAIGLHEPSEATTRLLGSIVAGDESARVRKEAAFWLGQTDRLDALTLLMQAARHDRSGEVREQGVFAISQMEGEGAVDSLIALARAAGEQRVRSQAIFWLGQKASRKATAAISGIIEKDEDTEVQKSALYALSQLPGDEGLAMLIRIAKSHRNAQLRKSAINILGQSEDARAVEALVEIVRN